MAPKKPQDFDKALQLFDTFTKLDPEKIGSFASSFKIPTKMYLLGSMEWTYYESKKWENKMHAYKHEHEAGVKIYTPQNTGGVSMTVNEDLRTVKTLVRLGGCLGVDYKDLNGELNEIVATKPYPSLYSIPNGNCLLIIQGKSKLIAIIAGGRLDVTARGIVG